MGYLSEKCNCEEKSLLAVTLFCCAVGKMFQEAASQNRSKDVQTNIEKVLDKLV